MSGRFKTIDKTACVPHAFCKTFAPQRTTQKIRLNLLSKENLLSQIVVDGSSCSNIGTLVLGSSVFEQEHNPVDFASFPSSLALVKGS